jgi:hypothetical protein
MKVRCPYKCDYCLNQKGETNHWWLRPHDPERFTLLAWDEALAGEEGNEHICSESCAAKALSKWMTRSQFSKTDPTTLLRPRAFPGPRLPLSLAK